MVRKNFWKAMPLLALVLLFGCIKDEETSDEKQIKADDELVKQYIENNNIQAERDDIGFYYAPITSNPSGQAITAKDIIYFRYKMSLLNGTVLEDKSRPTDSIQKAMHNHISTLRGYNRSFYPIGLDFGLGYMKEGEKFLFIIPSYLAYYSASEAGVLPAYSNLAVELEIIDIVSEAQQKAVEKDSIDAYIERNALENVTQLPSGLHYVKTEEGTGSMPTEGKTVKVHYTGKLLNEKVFDKSVANEPISFVLGKGQVIDGWDEGIALMKEGEKGRLIIPSHLAYYQSSIELPQKISNVSIPPFSILIFDVELVDIQ